MPYYGPMRILVLGGGGREHAIYLKLLQSPLAEKVFFGPGNGGAPPQDTISLDPLDFEGIEKVCRHEKIGLLVVGPEAPLAAGIKDYMAERFPELLVFGPDKNGAQLEASKVFSDNFMAEAGIPTAKGRVASSLEESLAIMEEHPLPVVIKADGLAAGKGVSIHDNKEEALQRLREIFEDNIFGKAGSQVLFQEFLQGEEASLFAICNGKEAIYLPTARDYKRVGDNDEGPNTGGMGSYSPGSVLTPSHIDFIDSNIVGKVIDKFGYTGILYVGLMVYGETVSVVEFNCRLGDPETQCVLPMMESDLLPYLLWGCGAQEIPFRVARQNHFITPTKPGYAVNVVLAAAGYPASYQKGIPLELPSELPADIQVVHAGTARQEECLASSGGRILSVVAFDKERQEARRKAYAFVETLKGANDFEKLIYRTDIAQ